MRCLCQGALVLVAFLQLPGVAAAHDFWIEPSSFRPHLGEIVSIHLHVGEYFVAERVPRMAGRIDRFVLANRNGTKPVPGRAWADPAGEVAVGTPGLAVIGFESTGSWSQLDGESFERYLVEEGLERIVAARAERGERAAASREIFVRCAKTMLAVGRGAPKADHWPDQPLGLTLELVSERNPYRLVPGDRLPLELLYLQEPVEGVLVTAIHRDQPLATLTARSDTAGRVSFRLPLAGVWLIKAVHMVADDGSLGGEKPDADWRSYWASVTFELPRVAVARLEGAWEQ